MVAKYARLMFSQSKLFPNYRVTHRECDINNDDDDRPFIPSYFNKTVSCNYIITGLPTKVGTLTTTVELLSGQIKRFAAINCTVPKLSILFINVYEGIVKRKDLFHC